MPRIIREPALIASAGSLPKRIEEFFGRVNTGTQQVSIARMQCPQGWVEPGQTPAFDEYTLVLQGVVRIRTRRETFDVCAGQAVIIERGEWVQYSAPGPGGAQYIAVCVPAFSPDSAGRDANGGPAGCDGGPPC